jgi:hypothetical protein
VASVISAPEPAKKLIGTGRFVGMHFEQEILPLPNGLETGYP